MKKLRKEDYTVGWICALPVPEWQASRLQFDDEHEDPYLGQSTNYQYAFGEMNGHNVVMGCLPDAEMGAFHAAGVATEIQSVFPSLRFGLLVGIGGGVPNEMHDVRLGDVVVSRPNKEKGHSGVIRHDFGKHIQGGNFQPIGMLNAPPSVLLSALGKVRAAVLPFGSKFPEYLHSYRNWSAYAPEFSKPPAIDQLFEPEYLHPCKEATCIKCSTQREVKRPARLTQPDARHPVIIHYGTIASGSQVIKDAIKRDQINDEHDQEILCFEMEAAGLVNFPCLVIRGISDYCDSHKNKAWQPFASAAAASWAKELLRNIAPGAVLSGDTVVHMSQRTTARVITMLPYGRDKHFVGRESNLEELHRMLFATEEHSRVGIVGLGGIGKSQVATEYAYRVRQSQPNISILWVYSSSRERFRNDFQSIATEVQLPGFDDLKQDHLGMVLDWLRGPSSGKWLLILDNADSKDMTSTSTVDSVGGDDFNIPRYLPRKPGCAVLITSRDKQAAFDLVGDPEYILNVKPMSEDEAVQLFRNKTRNREWDRVQAHRLAEQLDFIPLAITQAAAYIMARDRMTIGAYLELLQMKEDKLLNRNENDSRRDVNVPNSVIKAWEVSFRQIKAINNTAANLLFKISFLDRHEIPIWLLEQDGCSRAELNEALETLLRFSFIECPSTDRPNTLRIHRLVQSAANFWIQATGESAQWCFESLKLLWAKYPNGDFEDWKTCRILEPHATNVLESSFFNWTSEPLTTSTTVEQPGDGSMEQENLRSIHYSSVAARRFRAQLLYKRAVYAHRQTRYEIALEMARQAQSDFQFALGNHHADTLNCGGLLAALYLDLGHLEDAASVGASVVELQREIVGAEHHDTLSTMNTLAMVYSSLGWSSEAEKILLDIASVHDGNPVVDAEAIIMAMNNLALVLGDQEQWARKEQLEQASLQTAIVARGQHHPDTLSIQHNLATSLERLGKWPEARILLERIVEGTKQAMPSDHPQIYTSTGHLASFYWRIGLHREAFILQKGIFQDGKEVLGAYHPEILRCTSDIAFFHQEQGDLDQAYKLQCEALDLHQVRWGENNPVTLTCLENLARLLKKMGFHHEARDALKDCTTRRHEYLGARHEDTLRSVVLTVAWNLEDRSSIFTPLGSSSLLDDSGSSLHTQATTLNPQDSSEDGEDPQCSLGDSGEAPLPSEFEYFDIMEAQPLVDSFTYDKDEAPCPDEFELQDEEYDEACSPP